jgi:hypothetical protein
MTTRMQAATKAPAARRNDPRAEPEIHLHGDIHVHTYHDGTSSVAVDSGAKKLIDDIQSMEYREAGMAPINATTPQKAGRTSLNDVWGAFNEAVDRLSDRIERLEHRTFTVRNVDHAIPMPDRKPLADEDSSEAIRGFSDVWLRLCNLTDKLDGLTDQLEL